MTQVIKAFTLNFFQAILLPINQSSIRLVTSVLYQKNFYKIFTTKKTSKSNIQQKDKKSISKKKKTILLP